MPFPLSTFSPSYFEIPSFFKCSLLEPLTVKQRFSKLNNSESRAIAFITGLLASTYFIKDIKYRSLAILTTSIAGACFIKKLFTKQTPIQTSPVLYLKDNQINPLSETTILRRKVKNLSFLESVFKKCGSDELNLKIYCFLIQYTPLPRNLTLNNKKNLLDTLPLDPLSQAFRYLDLRSIFNILAAAPSLKKILIDDNNFLLKDLYDSINPQLKIDTSEEIIYSSTDPRKAVYPSLKIDNDSKSPQNKDYQRWLGNYGKNEYSLLKNPYRIVGKLRSTEPSDTTVLHLNDGKLITGNSKGGVTIFNHNRKKQYFLDSKITGVQVDESHSLITTQSGIVKIYNHQFRETFEHTSRYPISCAQMNKNYIILGHSQAFSTPVHISLWNRNNFVPFMSLFSTGLTEGSDVTSLQWDQDRVFYTLREGQSQTSQLYQWDIRTKQSTALLSEPFINNLYAENYTFHKNGDQFFLAVDGGISVYDERFTDNSQMFIPTTQHVTSIQADAIKFVASTSIFDYEQFTRKGSILMWDREALNANKLEPTRTINKPNRGISVCQFQFNSLAVGMYDTGHTALLEF